MSEVEILTVSQKGQIVLPIKVRGLLGIKQGTKLLMIQENGELKLKKAETLLTKGVSKEKLFTLLASEKALAKGWFSREEDEAWKDL